MAAERWAIVQHSGALTGHVEFEQAVESRALTGKVDQNRVEKAGGELFGSYEAAEDFCEAANYQPGNDGLIPQVAGTFSVLLKVDGLRIYIPVRKTTVVG